MPNKSLSVYMTAFDGMSPVLATIADKTRALDKESQELQQTYVALQQANKGLIDRKVELGKELKAVNEEVKAAKKNFDELKDAASEDAYKKALENQQKLRDEIAATNKSLQENQKIYKENIETIRKGGVEGEAAGLSGLSSLGTVVAGLGIWNQVSSLMQSGAGKFLESSLGSGVGGVASGALSSAISGAVLGNSIAPGGIGAAIGAAAGGLLGAVGGGMEELGNRDDAFKDYYGGLYEDVKGRSGAMVEAGSTIAGGREQTHMAFSQRLGGDDQATAYLAQVEKMAASTNYEYDEIVGYAKLLLNSYDPGEVFDVLRDLSDATAGLNLSSSDVNMMISGLSRMRTTGKATQEYLNYFRERGVDTDQALADSLNVDKSAVADMVKKGEIGGENAAEAILTYIQNTFGRLSDDLAGTYDAMMDNLGDMEASINAAGGDAYNSLRKSGVSAQQKAYEGELGEALKEINKVLGENQARKENLQDQYMREVLDAVLNGNQGSLWSTFDAKQQQELTEMSKNYASLMERYQSGDADAGAELESLYEQAQALGQAYFDNSGEVAWLNEIEREEVAAIRENTAGLDEATQASYMLSQELSNGRAGGWELPAKSDDGPAPIHLGSARQGYAQRGRSELPGSGGLASPRQAYARRSHAFGLPRVPYDEYPALLHADERVLTAGQARAQDAQNGAPPIQLTVTGNDFVGTGEEMADQVAEVIVRKLTQAAVAAVPK